MGLLNGFGSVDVIHEADKSKTLALPLRIGLEDGRGCQSNPGKHLLVLLSVQLLGVDVGEMFLCSQTCHAFLNTKQCE